MVQPYLEKVNNLSDVDSAVTSLNNLEYNEGAANAVNRAVNLKLGENVSVMDFGAVGNGVADDSGAINFAIEAVNNAGGGLVIFPPPSVNYFINYSINLAGCSNIGLIGVPGWKSIIKCSNNLNGEYAITQNDLIYAVNFDYSLADIYLAPGGGGSGYSINEVLALTGSPGTFVTAPTVTVTSVGSGGVITGISVTSLGGLYTQSPPSAAPANPLLTSTMPGSGAQFTAVWQIPHSNIVVQDLVLDCSLQNNSLAPEYANFGTNLCAMEFDNINYVQVFRCKIISAFGNGVVFGTVFPGASIPVIGCRVQDCIFENCVTGLLSQYQSSQGVKGLTGDCIQMGAAVACIVRDNYAINPGGPFLDFFNATGCTIEDNYVSGYSGNVPGSCPYCTQLTAADLTLVNQGSNYEPGDYLFLTSTLGGAYTPGYSVPLVLSNTSLAAGPITAFEVVNGGCYSIPPSGTAVTLGTTSVNGSGATFNVGFAAPTVVAKGSVMGTSTWLYEIEAVMSSGFVISGGGYCANGASTLSYPTSYNQISWSNLGSGVSSYNIFRTGVPNSGSPSPSTTGKIANVTGSTYAYNDGGVAGDGSMPSPSTPYQQTVGTIRSDFGLLQCTIRGNTFVNTGGVFLSGIMLPNSLNGYMPTPGPQNCVIDGNIIYHPTAALQIPSPTSNNQPTSGTPYTNTYNVPVQIMLSGGSSVVVAICSGSGATGSIASVTPEFIAVNPGRGNSIVLHPADSVKVTYTTAPSWFWYLAPNIFLDGFTMVGGSVTGTSGSANYNLVTNNQIVAPGVAAFNLTDSAYNQFTGNYLQNPGASSSMIGPSPVFSANAITLGTGTGGLGSSNNIFANNQIFDTGSPQTILANYSATSTLCKYNTISNNRLEIPGAGQYSVFVAAETNYINGNYGPGNPSSNPAGPFPDSVLDTQPTVPPTYPNSGCQFLNPYPSDAFVSIHGGTVSSILIGPIYNAVSFQLSPGVTSGTFLVRYGDVITLTYTSAPSWTWWLR